MEHCPTARPYPATPPITPLRHMEPFAMIFSRCLIFRQNIEVTLNNENLIPPKPGEPSRNPNGRPKGSKNRSTVLREILQMVIECEDLSGVKVKHPVEVAVMQALAKKALAGDVPAIKEIQDTVYGKLTDSVELDAKSSDGSMSPLKPTDMEIIRRGMANLQGIDEPE